jgi:hypothetical protein
MIDPTAAPSSHGSEDGSEAAGGSKKPKLNAHEKIRLELDDLLIVHERKVKDFWQLADSRTHTRLLSGTNRAAYHLDRLGGAQTKARTKLSDPPGAEKWEARAADYKSIKDGIELFKNSNIDRDFNKLKKGPEFLAFIDTLLVPARRAVLRVLPLLAVRWAAQLRLEMCVRSGQSPMPYLHMLMLIHSFPSIVLATTGEQGAFQLTLLEIALSEALTKAATLHQDIEQQASFVLLVFKPEADEKMEESQIEMQYPADQKCKFDNMYANNLLHTSALHLVQVIQASQLAGSKWTLSESLNLVRTDDNVLFNNFRANEKVAGALFARADAAVRTCLKTSAAQQALENFQTSLSSLQESMVKALPKLDVFDDDEETTALMEALAQGVRDCARCQTDIASTAEPSDTQNAQAQLGKLLKPIVTKFAKGWNQSAIPAFVSHLGKEGWLAEVDPEGPGGHEGYSKAVTMNCAIAMNQHRQLRSRFEAILADAEGALRAANAAAPNQVKQLLPGHTVSKFFDSYQQIFHDWLSLYSALDPQYTNLPVVQSSLGNVFRECTWNADSIDKFTRLCKSWKAFTELSKESDESQRTAFARWFVGQGFIEMLKHVLDDGAAKEGGVLRSILARCTSAVSPVTWVNLLDNDKKTGELRKTLKEALAHQLDEEAISQAHSVCLVVDPATTQALQWLKNDSVAKVAFALALTTSLSVAQSTMTCKSQQGRVEKALKAVEALKAAAESLIVPDEGNIDVISGLQVHTQNAGFYTDANDQCNTFAFRPFIKSLGEQLNKAVTAIPPRYAEIVEAGLEEALRNTFLKKPSLMLAAQIDELLGHSDFIKESKVLTTCPSTAADNDVLRSWASAQDVLKACLKFFGTCKIVNLVMNKLAAESGVKTSAHGKSLMIKSSAWLV